MLQLTVKGEKILRELSVHHEEELRNLGPQLVSSLRRMMAAITRPARKKTPAQPGRGKSHKR
jgi:hypothetical protein